MIGVKIGQSVFPILYREGDVRFLAPGKEIVFMTNCNGYAEVISPKPRIGCEREK